MDHVAGPLHILLVEKRGEDLLLYDMSQTLSIWEKYLVVFVRPRNCSAIRLEICHAEINIEYVIQEVGLTKILGDHETLSLVRHVGLYVDFSFITNLLWAFRPSCVKWTWMVSALSTSESSWIVMVTCLQSCVWSGHEKASHLYQWRDIYMTTHTSLVVILT